MENFFKIRAEKQDHIINAAFTVFGRQGYKKASVADIAQAAGITKGMITYYFGSKKNLYLYLAEASQSLLINTAKELILPNITDFFEKLKITTEILIEAVKEHPALISFINSLYIETDPEVAGDIEKAFDGMNVLLDRFLMEDTDFSKFKSGVEAPLICRFCTWASDGFMEKLFEPGAAENIDALAADFEQCLELIRNAFYR